MPALSCFLFVHATAPWGILSEVFWPYFIGAALLLIGLVRLYRSGAMRLPRSNKAIALGSVFYAVPMGVFAGDHFTAPREIAAMVPSWIPAHLFWAWFVGVALAAAALSIVIDRYSALAAGLLALMLALFALLIDIPNLAANSGNRIFWILPFRELTFSAAALALAISRCRTKPGTGMAKMIHLARCIIAAATLFFGVEEFLYPQSVPVIPLAKTMPSWIPAHVPISYVTGAIMIALGLAILLNWKARLDAICLGIFVTVIVLLVYLPLMITNASDISNGLNYFADTLVYGGGLLLLAGVLPDEALLKTQKPQIVFERARP